MHPDASYMQISQGLELTLAGRLTSRSLPSFQIFKALQVNLNLPVQCCLPMLTSFDHPEQARTRHSCRFHLRETKSRLRRKVWLSKKFHLISIKESVSLALRFVLQPAGIKGTAKKLFGFFHDLRQGWQKGAGTGKEEDTS